MKANSMIEALVHSVYDNGGDTADRYTIFTNECEGNMREALVCDDRPTHPQGFSQFTVGAPGRHCGKRIAFTDLPPNVQQHIKARLGEAGATLPREPQVEAALSWANQQGYCFASAALTEYCDARGMLWSTDPMYNYVTFTELDNER